MSLNLIKSIVFSQESKLGRDKGSTKIIAVSKLQPNDRVKSVLESGHRIFGENRVQEASEKWPEFKKNFNNVELHLLGPLQRNKVRQAVELFDFIHTIDSLKLAQRISLIAKDIGCCPKLFIQVNTGQEPQKAGVKIEDLKELLAICRELSLPVVGLMCIPPVEEDPYIHFNLLKSLREKYDVAELSMGMSGDFEKAILAGASYIRVGSAIFGERP
jgi:pyridoxal phosphate enzyme (YggS family)|tara:strand:- start:69 stop:716 length:648 start_codon:yes stop_codon:yes gene_type:complete